MEHEKKQTLFAWRGEMAFGITTAIMTRLMEQVGNKVKLRCQDIVLGAEAIASLARQ
jgi:hypothetical protein